MRRELLGIGSSILFGSCKPYTALPSCRALEFETLKMACYNVPFIHLNLTRVCSAAPLLRGLGSFMFEGITLCVHFFPLNVACLDLPDISQRAVTSLRELCALH